VVRANNSTTSIMMFGRWSRSNVVGSRSPGPSTPRFSDSTVLSWSSSMGFRKNLRIRRCTTICLISRKVGLWLTSDKFVQERTDKKLMLSIRDKQGHKDYSTSDKIYCQLNQKQIKIFCKKTYYWDVMDIYQLKIVQNSQFWKRHVDEDGNVYSGGSFCCSPNN
jgi:hypothetical protein